MKQPRRQVALLPVAVLAAFYATAGITFAFPTTHVGAWRLAAWVVSGLAYAAHLLYEHYYLRNAARVAALHLASAAALGALGLAIGALVHSISAGMPSEHQRLLLIALVLWPLITGVPAFVVGLAASALVMWKKSGANRPTSGVSS